MKLTEKQKDTALPPHPGSVAAVALGCTCPVMDNAHGRGWLGREGLFVYTVGCPVHDHDHDRQEGMGR